MIDVWQGLTEVQRTLVIVGFLIGFVGAGLGILYAYARHGVDFSGFGEWLKSLRD